MTMQPQSKRDFLWSLPQPVYVLAADCQCREQRIDGLCHANLPLRPGLFGWFFNTPEWHQLHHSLNYDESNTNYGCTLIIWDRIFGTYSGKSTIERVGNGTGRRLSFWTQYTLPFRSNKNILDL